MPTNYNAKNLRCRRPGCNRRIALFAVIAVVLYSGLWYFASQLIQNEIVHAFGRMQSKNNIVICENMNKAGYPLRVGVGCDSLSFSQLSNDVSLNTRRITATAPIYALTWAEFSVASPATLHIPDFLPLSANWKELKLITDINAPIPNKISLSTEGITIAAKDKAGNDYNIFSADLFRMDTHEAGNNLLANIAFDKAQFPFFASHKRLFLPAIEGNIRLQLANTDQLLVKKIADIKHLRNQLRGHTGTIERAEFHLQSGGKLSLSGPFSIDDGGYLSATLDLSIGDQTALLNSARTLFPSQAQNMNTVFFVINSMPKNQQGEPVFKINIRQGEARLGFIKLGHIDPI